MTEANPWSQQPSPVIETVVEAPIETEAVVEVNTTETAPEVPTTEEQTVPPVDEAQVEQPIVVAPEIKEVIKEVEKIVEKYPEMDEHTKEIFDALMAGEEDVLLNYLSEKKRDYNTMSDYDVVKAQLKKDNPRWSNEDVELQIEVKYGELVKIDLNSIDAELDPEKYERAEAHNRQVDRNEKLLKVDARDARIALTDAKKELKLPKIKVEEIPSNEPTPEQIAANQLKWEEDVTAEVPKLTEFVVKVGDKESGYEDVSYKVADTEKADLVEFMKGFNLPSLAKRLGWVDKDGKPNIQKAAGDVLKLEKDEQRIKSAYTQGKTAGAKGTIAEIKNIDLKNQGNHSVQSVPGELNPFAHLVPK